MKTILICGAGGFLGSELIQAFLMYENVQIYALSSKNYSLKIRYSEYKNFDTVECIPENVDLLINCVFPSNANGKELANGLQYIANLYNEAIQKKVKAVINISSQSVYDQKKNMPASEKNQCNLRTSYAVGKYAVEMMTNTVFRDIHHTNIRLASLVGINSDLRIVNRFVKQVIEGKELFVVADRQQFGFLDVRDAAQGIVKFALSESATWEETYNLGRNESYSLQNIAKIVVEIGHCYGFNSLVNIGDEVGDVRDSTLECSKIMEFLNWKAEITLEKSIHDIYKNYLGKVY